MKGWRAVDLFAGAGGWSTAARRVGLNVVCAVNHWPVAVATHQANHPETEHHCASLHGFDPRVVTPSPRVTLASPSCTGHTRARGKERAHHDEARATAHAVTDLIDAWRSDWLFVENVAEFCEWDRYPAWRNDLECMGYRVGQTVLDSADFGFPQSRKRLYVVANRINAPIRLPLANFMSVKKKPTAVGSIIDWSNLGEPITEERFGEKTTAQIAAGRVARGSRFLCAYYKSERARSHTRSVDMPCGTIVTHDRFLVVNGDHARFLTVQEMLKLQDFPADYILCGTASDHKKMIGNAVHVGMGEIILRSVLDGM